MTLECTAAVRIDLVIPRGRWACLSSTQVDGKFQMSGLKGLEITGSPLANFSPLIWRSVNLKAKMRGWGQSCSVLCNNPGERVCISVGLLLPKARSHEKGSCRTGPISGAAMSSNLDSFAHLPVRSHFSLPDSHLVLLTVIRCEDEASMTLPPLLIGRIRELVMLFL